MEIYGYRRNYFCSILTWLAILATGFLLRLVFYWKPQWMLYSTFSRCALGEAQKVLLIDKYSQYFVEDVKTLVLQKSSFAKFLFRAKKRSPNSLPSGESRQSDDEDYLECPDNKYATNSDDVQTKSQIKRQTYGSLVLRCDTQFGKKVSAERQRTYSSKSNVSSNLDAELNDHNDYETVKVEDNPLLIEMDENGANGDGGGGSNLNGPSTVLEESFESTGSSSAAANSTTNNSGNDDINKPSLENAQISEIRYFENKKVRYIWDENEKNFVKLRGLDKNVKFSELKRMTSGLNENEQYTRRQLFGENAIHIEVQSYVKILFEEVLGPFYIFQLFSIIIWFNDDYYYYATCLIVMSFASLVSSILQIRRNQEQLRDTVETVDYVKVCRGNDNYVDIESSQLVPGDIVVVPTFNTILQFDAILINGNVIINESMLTGESVPVTKTPFPFESYGKSQSDKHQQNSLVMKSEDRDGCYDEKEHSKHTLFCGTKVLQTRYYGGANVKAIVLRTGFQTTKGELIRSIMFPKPVDFRFNRQIHKFVGILAGCAFFGMIYTVALKVQRGATFKDIFIKAFDLITITVPPALPAAMTIGIIYAQSRLKKNKIFCISPRSINISGCINCVCFDKTGTLTEDDLSFNEVVPLIESRCEFGKPFDEDVMQTTYKQVEREHHILLENGDYSPLINCLASCHSLTKIDEKIIGDPLDLQMFQATGWVLEEPDVDDENKFDLLAPTIVRPPKHKRRTSLAADVYEKSYRNQATSSSLSGMSSSTEDELDIVARADKRRRCQDVGVLRQFPFSSSLQRMSVVTRQFNGTQYIVYAKGAPEKIASLCDQKTIPADFGDILHRYTRKGFRVIALAYRPLKKDLSYARMQRASRTAIEKDLRFLGLLTLGNLLKPETISAIDTLNKAAIRSVMVTGDNMFTAISVANECGMILSYDRTIMLQIDKSAATSGADEQSDASQHYRYNAGSTNPLILSVENVEYQFKHEKEPILSGDSICGTASASATTKIQLQQQQPKPTLTWKYVSNDIDASSTTNSNGDTVMLKLSDNNRLHLALTGDTWDVIMKYYPEILDAVCIRGTVFARMSPNQKQQLVERLQSLQYYVGMCGDGANDSGALRAAHAGISLSDTEASVAAPFTSANANISCLPILISEGRAALVTAFSILKYMALYSLIQFCSVIILYTVYSNFTDFEFMYQDLFIIATVVAFFGRTESCSELARKPPPSSLMSLTQLASCSIQLVLAILFQALACFLLWRKPWYEANGAENDGETENESQDNYAMFAMSAFQCISLAIVFSKGKPYRKSILSNYLFTAALALMVLTTITVLLIPAEWEIPYITQLHVRGIPIEFRVLMLCLGLFHFILAIIGERCIVDHWIFTKSGKLFEILGIGSQKLLYEKIDLSTQSTHWLYKIVKEVA